MRFKIKVHANKTDTEAAVKVLEDNFTLLGLGLTVIGYGTIGDYTWVEFQYGTAVELADLTTAIQAYAGLVAIYAA